MSKIAGERGAGEAGCDTGDKETDRAADVTLLELIEVDPDY
ncbi:hypothetical protein [Paenibacillus cymbidii]|nr:hypothetical protein [Paenibacillus cymbidii]